MFNQSRRNVLKAIVGGALVGPVFPSRFAWSGPATGGIPSSHPLVSKIGDLGKQFLNNPVGVTGADGATSTVLPSGESLWVFGDTVEGPFKSIHGLDLTNLRSNTAAIVPKQNASDGIKSFKFLTQPDRKRPGQIVPFEADEDSSVHRVWAVHGTCIGKSIYLYYHRITLLKGVDVFVNFKLDGMGIARAEIGSFRFKRLQAPDGTREFWKGDEPGFGVFVESTDDYVYLWGSLATGMFLARVRPSAIEDLAAYEYLVEAPTLDNPDVFPRWSETFQPTGMLFDAVPNEMSASYNRHLDKYVAFHSLHRERKIVMRTAPRITGPWSAAEVVYQPPKEKESDLIYAVKEHPELSRDGGQILYVTFVNSASYIPQLIEVTLE
jgi:hypothetical protein